MPARKIPLVWKSAKQSEQTLFKYNPATQSVVRIGCGCAVPPPPPTCESFYPTYGYLVYEQHLDVYPYGPVYFWANSSGMVESPPVAAPDYNGTTATRCNKSYTVLGEVNPPPSFFQFIRVAGSGDPGSGGFSIIPNTLPNVILNISITDANSQDATNLVSNNIANALNIKIQKDISNYVILTRISNTDNTTYWSYDCTILSSAGVVNTGDTVTITPA